LFLTGLLRLNARVEVGAALFDAPLQLQAAAGLRVSSRLFTES
jgi:hypothetical protein